MSMVCVYMSADTGAVYPRRLSPVEKLCMALRSRSPSPWRKGACALALPLPGAKVRAQSLPTLRLLCFLLLPRRRCYLRLAPLSLLVLYTVSAFRF
jgi:hypothetical protein